MLQNHRILEHLDIFSSMVERDVDLPLRVIVSDQRLPSNDVVLII